MPEPLQLDGYIRVSKVGGRAGDSFISPDDQRDRIQAWATSRGVQIAKFHVDLDQSGGQLQRPGLDALMRRIRSKETSGVAVAYVDRLSRADVGNALALVTEIHEAGGQLAALDLGIDPTTPFGEFGMTILLALGRMQRRRISEGWEAATGRAIARGVHTHAPFGYDKPHKGASLEVDENLRPVVAELFKRRAGGASWTALAEWLDTKALSSSGGMWTRRAVETVIANPAYLGEARYGKHRNPTAHEPIVGRDLWEAAQLARAPRPPRGEPGLLSGLVRCAGCRHRMQPASVGSPKQKIYRCPRRHSTGICQSVAYVSRNQIEPYVERLFLAHYGASIARGFVANDGLEAARRRLADADAELTLYRDNTSARAMLDKLGGGHFEAGLGARVDAVLQAREGLEEARRGAVNLDLGPALAVWPDLSVSERREVFTEGIDAVFLRRADVAGTRALDGRVKVFWRGEAPNDLPGPGLRVDLRGIDW